MVASNEHAGGNENSIVIDLEQERIGSTEIRDVKDLIQQDALRNVLEYLASSRKPKTCETSKSDSLKQAHKHDTIMVAGQRGGGKTTFVVNLLGILKNQKSLKEY